MGVFADAMEAAATGADAPATGDVATQPDSSPESPAAPSGTAPSTPTPQTKDHPSPSGARTPAQPARPFGESQVQGKQVDLRALHEARNETKQWRDAYSWLPREEAPHVRTFMSAYKSDPSGTLLGELEPHLSNPQDRQRIVQWLEHHGVIPRGRGGNGRVQQQGGDDDPEPVPDFKLPDGTTFMSAERQAEWRAWHARQDEKRFDEKIQPIQQFVTASQRAQVQAATVAQANQFAEHVFADAKKWPHFTENQAAIAAKYPEYSGSMPAQAALMRAYVAVLEETVFPTLTRTEREKAAADLHARTRATTPNPTRPTGTPSDRRPESFRDAAERILGSRR